ncbi:substrate-binding periplasmic protein [Maridesulfovibrio salexigens]|uniref:Extracellular solute-binding protein family 3 n=1 Tax=Maridesulfovibrio salexigens (strain ATCC 14822 / DSM 2638 / NCIMB 8403 / VKM B-1763) TaxID=526222 RepID=C6BYY8_MARSD|nr:transporter substrate-binding domain-containing protein [Maridesulfovibrio salexigens]ACS78812.1 extracellular solute-binding protein family 3 [Maridesulfovibrio salexigens DSM 2638]
MLLVISFLFLPTAAKATESTLLVSGQIDWQPFLMKDNTGKVYGLMYEILEKAAHANGYTLEYRDMPWKRAVISLEKGKLDIMCGIFWNKNRARQFLFSPPILRNELHIFTNKPFKLERLIDLQGKTGDHIRGGSYGDLFDSFITSGKARFVEVTDDNTAINRLVRGYSDFFIGTYVDTTIKLSKRGLEQSIIALPYIVDTVNVYFAYPQKTKKKHSYEKINRTLEQMQASGEISKLINQYFNGTGIDPRKVIFKPEDLRGH